MDEKIIIDDKINKYNTSVTVINVILRFIAIIILLFGIKQDKYDIGTFVMLYGLSESCTSKMSAFAKNIFSGLFDDAKYFKGYYDLIYPMTNKEIREALSIHEAANSSLCLGEFQKLEAKEISFTYPGANHKALNQVSFSIHRGEIISILGDNGSGKTTLSKILCGAYTPEHGNVNINDKPITNYPTYEIFKYFGIAPQDYSKFSLSIRDIVGLGYIEKMNDKQEIDAAYQKSNLYELFNQYGKKDSTIIGKEYDSEGVDVSGGEMQRIIITSAYMGNPEILILDEPTASIDPLKEIEMLKNFRDILKDKTAILISHRIGFARLADKIIILKDGKIVEQGSHHELLNKQGYYFEMFNQQKHLYE